MDHTNIPDEMNHKISKHPIANRYRCGWSILKSGGENFTKVEKWPVSPDRLFSIGILMGPSQKLFCLPLFMNLQDGVKVFFHTGKIQMNSQRFKLPLLRCTVRKKPYSIYVPIYGGDKACIFCMYFLYKKDFV